MAVAATASPLTDGPLTDGPLTDPVLSQTSDVASILLMRKTCLLTHI